MLNWEEPRNSLRFTKADLNVNGYGKTILLSSRLAEEMQSVGSREAVIYHSQHKVAEDTARLTKVVYIIYLLIFLSIWRYDKYSRPLLNTND